MASGHSCVRGNFQSAANAEDQLAATLMATSDEIAHSDCLDAEERSEVYTIVEAILADTRVHRQTIELLAHSLPEGGADA
ncbi:MAG: hypothetical protein WBF17_04615 [Phycisphaerae bacterium]